MFYLKLTVEEAQQMISKGIGQLFGGVPSKFSVYTSYIEDTNTGYKYWRVENLQYAGATYDIIGWLNSAYPNITKYDYEFVSQFLPVHDGV